ncbi:MAG: copper amine oxidase protein [Paenibacillus sp.]|nr:copper amine oxidase protein [Paenibacillus sp.]
MGAELVWDAKTSTATIMLGGRTVDVTVGAKTIRVDGKTVPLKADPAYLQPFVGESKTYLPLAALSEGLGFQVEYRHEKRIAFING